MSKLHGCCTGSHLMYFLLQTINSLLPNCSYLSASDSDTSLTDDSDHDAQHRGDVEQHGHDDPGSDSDGSEQSYDEGSYDGRKGEIVYTGRDNETVSGAKQDEMYDHGIRETYVQRGKVVWMRKGRGWCRGEVENSWLIAQYFISFLHLSFC